MRGPTPHATRGSGKESSFSIRLSTFNKLLQVHLTQQPVADAV